MELSAILQLAKSLSRLRRSCTYYKVDLHVHSPKSSDYKGDPSITPYEFVSAYVARGFDMIAITDHNAGSFIDEAIEARNRIEKDEGRKIIILPGVEINVTPGVHLLAIFGGGGTARISDLLSSLQLPVEKRGETAEPIRLQIEEIARLVHDRKGLLVGAHCNSTHGVVKELRGEPRLDWLSALDALDINSGQSEEKASKTMCYVTNDLGVTIPFTFGSDSHDAASDSIGMWVKMAEPSISSLRQITFEPELRVSRTEPHISTHGRIVGFTTTQGIYANENFRFSPNLNVLLGGRGAGKSAAIDLLRFAFEAEPRSDDDSFGVFANRIAGFLQSVGEVIVVVGGTDGETYAITRSGAYERPKTNGKLTFRHKAQVFQIANEKLIAREMRPYEALGIEFYGQGEAARLADRVDEQLRLIDEHLDLATHEAVIVDAEQELSRGETQIIEYQQAVEELQVRAARRPKLEEHRDQLRESLDDPIFVERQKWDRGAAWMEARQDLVKELLEDLPEFVQLPDDLDFSIEDFPAKSVLERVREVSNRVLESSSSKLQQFRQTVEEVLSELDDYRIEWSKEFETAHNIYLERLSQLGTADLDQVADEHRNVEQELTLLETEIEPEIERIDAAIDRLKSRRVQLLRKLWSARLKINSARVEYVSELNTRLGGSVTIDLSSRDTSVYFDAVDSPLEGSGIHSREEQILLVCKNLTPVQFVRIARDQSVGKLEATGITRNSAFRMLRFLTDEDLFKIERIDIPPLPCIRIKREGETSFTDLSSLSVGEKCSAILSIALLNKEKPLIIDQPEDDLDHAFIIDSIVEGIRKAKSARQIITATHNPNIPVLGDAEMVFRVARRVGKDICHIQKSGGLELPQVTKEVQGLEGGAEAFERRRLRYTGVI
ncbi:MAG: AAA family ATPase [Caldilineaceae bacterium]|nr:AAA family ATPase [Caldilineaceae bacterium]